MTSQTLMTWPLPVDVHDQRNFSDWVGTVTGHRVVVRWTTPRKSLLTGSAEELQCLIEVLDEMEDAAIASAQTVGDA